MKAPASPIENALVELLDAALEITHGAITFKNLKRLDSAREKGFRAYSAHRKSAKTGKK